MHTTHCRLPRAGVDRIADPDTALTAVAMAMHRPVRAETIVLLLDDARRGRAIVVVSGTEHPDAVIEVVECLAHAAEDVSSMVIASVRPPGSGDVADPDGRTDVDRWLEMSDVAEVVGVEILEWFVIDQDVTCPRDALGAPPRW